MRVENTKKPPIFSGLHIQENTQENSTTIATVATGITAGGSFDLLAAGGGREVKMPLWKDLTATRQLLSDSGTLTVNKAALTASADNKTKTYGDADPSLSYTLGGTRKKRWLPL